MLQTQRDHLIDARGAAKLRQRFCQFTGVDRVITGRTGVWHRHHDRHWAAVTRIIHVRRHAQVRDVLLELTQLLGTEQLICQRVHPTNDHAIAKVALERCNRANNRPLLITHCTGQKLSIARGNRVAVDRVAKGSALAANQQVTAAAAFDLVITFVTKDDVDTFFILSILGARVAVQLVITRSTQQQVVAKATIGHATGVTANQNVIAPFTEQRILGSVIGQQQVIAIATEQVVQLVVITTRELVIATLTVNPVFSLAAIHDVVAAAGTDVIGRFRCVTANNRVGLRITDDQAVKTTTIEVLLLGCREVALTLTQHVQLICAERVLVNQLRLQFHRRLDHRRECLETKLLENVSARNINLVVVQVRILHTIECLLNDERKGGAHQAGDVALTRWCKHLFLSQTTQPQGHIDQTNIVLF